MQLPRRRSGRGASDPRQWANRSVRRVGSEVRGAPDTVRLGSSPCSAGGHRLVEGMPGNGKSCCQVASARSGGHYGRVQCTPDLLQPTVTAIGVGAATGVWGFSKARC